MFNGTVSISASKCIILADYW